MRSTGRFPGLGVANQPPRLRMVESGLWKESDRLRQCGRHSRASSRWFLKPRGIKAKPSDSENLRVTVAGSFLIPVPPPTSRRPPLSSPLPPPPWLWGHLSLPELAGLPVSSSPVFLGCGRRRSSLPHLSQALGSRGLQPLRVCLPGSCCQGPPLFSPDSDSVLVMDSPALFLQQAPDIWGPPALAGLSHPPPAAGGPPFLRRGVTRGQTPPPPSRGRSPSLRRRPQQGGGQCGASDSCVTLEPSPNPRVAGHGRERTWRQRCEPRWR